MRRQVDEAFILNTQALGEADVIVSLVAEQHGKIRAVAPSARRSRRRFGGALEPLTRVRASWLERDGRELHRLDGLDCVRSFAEMQADPLYQAACAVLSEISTALTHEGQSDPQGFRLLGAVLEALDAGGSPRVLLRYFEYWMLRIHGLLPDLAACSGCGRMLGQDAAIHVGDHGAIRCGACPREAGRRETTLTRHDREFLDRLRRLPPAALPAQAAQRTGASLERLLRGTLEAFAERSFRSYRHFRAAEAFPPEGESP